MMCLRADGTVNVCSVLSGLLFYRETRYMTPVQVVVTLIGLFVVLAGVVVSIRSRLPCQRASKKVVPSKSPGVIV
jgi:hypothetical protein